MKEMSFKVFCQKMSACDFYGDTPKGDFVGDVVLSRKFEGDFEIWAEVLSALIFCNACAGAKKAAKQVFADWQAICG